MLPACLLAAAVISQSMMVIDRIAVVVNRHVIKLSDINTDIRLTAFLNKTGANVSAAERKASEERLIDQQLIRAELASGGYRRASDKDADKLLQQIRHDRYSDSDIRLRQALTRYGLTEDQLREQLLWQLTVLAFINDRFRVGTVVSDEDVQSYYHEHRSDFPQPLDEALSGSIRQKLEAQQVNDQFGNWMAQSRHNAAIDYKLDFKTDAIP